MRIALFAETFLPKIDGVTNTLCRLLEHLAARGHRSLLFAPKGSPVQYAETPIVPLESIRFPLYPELRLASPFSHVRTQLEDFQPDLVHLVNPVSLGLSGLRQARRLGVPIVASYHTDIPGFAVRWGFGVLSSPLWAYFRWLHNQADLNLCPSRFTQSELLSHGFERVSIWTRGVDTVRFNPRYRSDEWRARLGAETLETPLLLYVGRLAPEKRVEWIRPVLDALPQARLAIVGDGPSRPALERRFADTGTVFTGYLRGEELSRAYAAADIFVFPAANETFGNVVLEAMASGSAVVVARAGGPLDFVSDGINGLLFSADDQQSLVDATLRLAQNRLFRQRLSKNARLYAEQRSWDAVLDGLLSDYAALIEKNRRKPALSRTTFPMPRPGYPSNIQP